MAEGNQPPDPDEDFVRNLTGHQHRLYGLILSMLPDPEQARDVLQDTNVVVWKKYGEFVPGTNFGAWSAKIAYFQVMAHRTARGRDRHIFDDDLILTLSEESEESSLHTDGRALALDSCMEDLEDRDRELLRLRYTKGNTITDLSEMIGKSPNATRVFLFRLRHLLLECVQRKIAHIQE